MALISSIDDRRYIFAVQYSGLQMPILVLQSKSKPPTITPVPCILGHDDDHAAIRNVRLLGLFVTLRFCLFRN